MPADPNIHPHWAQETKELARELDAMDYFQVLGLPQTASLDEIKERYHSFQRTYHPDTFYQSPDTDLKNAVFRISKRVAEAYVILRDPVRRTKYLRDIQSAQRDAKLRYTETADQERRKESQDIFGKTPQVRDLVRKAMSAVERGDLQGAIRDLKTALLFESSNEAIKTRLAEIQERAARKG